MCTRVDRQVIQVNRNPRPMPSGYCLCWKLSAIVDHNKVTCKKEFRMRTADQHAALLSYLDTVSWDYVLQECDTQAACDNFYQVMLAILDYFFLPYSISYGY